MGNILKEKLRNNEQVLGAFISINAPALVEIVGYSGFDFVVIDDEHGAFSPSELENLIRTADSVGLVPVVRVSYDPSSIQKALDRGAKGIQVPMVNTKEDALEVVNRVKFPPLGRRGASFSIRPARYGLDSGKSYLEKCNDEIIVIAHIETLEATKHFEEIIGTEGIDVAFIGTTDLSVDMGFYDKGAKHPDVQKIVRTLNDKGKEMKIPMGTVSGNAKGAKEAFDNGSNYVCVVLNSVMISSFTNVVNESKKVDYISRTYESDIIVSHKGDQ